MTRSRFLAAASALALLACPAAASEYPAQGYHSDVLYGIHSDAAQLERAKALDLRYVAEMGEHHRGALTMSQDYLKTGRNPVMVKLAQAIIANQRYEIAVLDEVGRQIARAPVRVASLLVQPIATEGMEHALRYIKAPPPSVLELNGTVVSEYDVRWAKAMIVHHQGALDMARAYNQSADARNRFLGLMNLDIQRDQAYEIAFMNGVIARFPGDATKIEPEPGMIHGMPMGGGSGHGGSGHGGHGAPAAPAPGGHAH